MDLDLTKFAEILVHRTETLNGRFFETYEWKGDPRYPVRVSWMFEDRVKDMPWPLYRVGADGGDPMWDHYYVRKDVAFWWVLPLKDKVQRFFWRIKARLIYTGMVWGIGYVNDWEIPSWRCLWRKRK